jgi:hypothetical protein
MLCSKLITKASPCLSRSVIKKLYQDMLPSFPSATAEALKLFGNNVLLDLRSPRTCSGANPGGLAENGRANHQPKPRTHRGQREVLLAPGNVKPEGEAHRPHLW